MNSRLVIALDYADPVDAYRLVDQLDPALCRVKVGKELFTRAGPVVVKQLMQRGFDVFLDLKFHDIPATCAKAVTAAADLGVWMVNVHASGGSKMMLAAQEALQPFGKDKPLLIAVTVLTSMNSADLAELGLPEPLLQAQKLALLAKQSGMDGVVCSAQEAAVLKQLCGADFLTVTPGIRPAGAALNDQQRILTPLQAVKQGADYLVIGRPITQHAQPLQQLQAIYTELSGN